MYLKITPFVGVKDISCLDLHKSTIFADYKPIVSKNCGIWRWKVKE